MPQNPTRTSNCYHTLASACTEIERLLLSCLIRSRPQPRKVSRGGKRMMVLLHREVATLMHDMQKVTW